MADQIGSFKFINQTPLGTLKDLGFKRAVAVLWKAARGDKPGVEGMFQRNFDRMDARAAIVWATADREFTADWQGLRQLLDRASQRDAHDQRNAATDTVYRATLFDTAWDSTIGKNRQALRDWKIQNKTTKLDRVKSALREGFASSEIQNTEKFIKGIADNGYLPRFELGPNPQRERKSQDAADDLRSLPRLPKGIYAARGSNFRQYDEQTSQFLAPSTADVRECFSIEPGNGAIALSFSGKGLDHCRKLNEDLLSHDRTFEPAGDEYGFIVRQDRHVWAAAPADDRLRIMVLLPPTDTADGVLDDLASHPTGIRLREKALVVAVSAEAAAALEDFGPIPDEALQAVFKATNPAEMLQSAFTQMVARSTAATMKKRLEALKELKDFGHLFKQVPPGDVPLRSHYVDCVNTILAGVDDPQRIPKDFGEKDFGELMTFIHTRSEAIRERLTRPIGGDLLILVMSPDQALPSTAPAPSASVTRPAPPPYERTDKTAFLFQDIGSEGEPLLKLKNREAAPPVARSSPEEIEKVSEDSSSTADSWGFDIDDYV